MSMRALRALTALAVLVGLSVLGGCAYDPYTGTYYPAIYGYPGYYPYGYGYYPGYAYGYYPSVSVGVGGVWGGGWHH
jgi:hypothetical protein